MSFGIYAIGAILIGGLIYGAYLVHIPTHWIITVRPYQSATQVIHI